MSSDRNKQLIQKLTAYDLAGTRYYDAKQALLQEGYTEGEIDQAAGSAPFDGKDNQPRDRTAGNPLHAARPADIERVAGELLSYETARRDRQLRIDMVSSTTWGNNPMSPISISADIRLAEAVGVPLLKLMGIGVFIAAILYGLMMNTSLVTANAIIFFCKAYAVGVGLYIDYRVFAILRLRMQRRRKTGEISWIRAFLETWACLIISAGVWVYVVIAVLGKFY
jgi:hypothetical protein